MDLCYPVISGVTQGLVIGPLLFSLFISDLVFNIKSEIVFFTDDTMLYAPPGTHYNKLQTDLDTILEWSKTWLMKLNEEKCTVLSIGVDNVELQYTLNNTILRHVQEQKDLGVIITSDLKWEQHISKIVKKSNSLIYCIQRAFVDRSIDSVLKLYKSFIRPKLEYGQTIWNPYFVKDIEMLERAQRRITKIPNDLADVDYKTRLSRLKLTTLKERRLRGDLIESYKIILGYYACNLDIFHFSQKVHLRGHSRKLEKEKTARP